MPSVTSTRLWSKLSLSKISFYNWWRHFTFMACGKRIARYVKVDTHEGERLINNMMCCKVQTTFIAIISKHSTRQRRRCVSGWTRGKTTSSNSPVYHQSSACSLSQDIPLSIFLSPVASKVCECPTLKYLFTHSLTHRRTPSHFSFMRSVHAEFKPHWT